jgi:uncharacterized membrane protein (UPF0127 family)
VDVPGSSPGDGSKIMNEKKRVPRLLFLVDALLAAAFIFAVIYMYEIKVNVAQSGQALKISTVSSISPVVYSQSQPLSLILATTSAEQELGLGQRASLPLDEGMLFIFPKADNYGFWMKDMHFPIDMIWLDENFSITHIESNVSPDTYPTVLYPGQKSLYVLETNAGYSQKNDLEVGESLDFIKNSLEKSR